MNSIKRTILPIVLATIWISISEFIRNELLLKTFWLNHYEGMGLVFPSEPINGVVWGIWSLCFAISIFIISRKFSLKSTTVLSWFVGFVLMWIVAGNLSVLPYKILFFAIPLSLLEAFLASLIFFRMSRSK